MIQIKNLYRWHSLPVGKRGTPLYFFLNNRIIVAYHGDDADFISRSLSYSLTRRIYDKKGKNLARICGDSEKIYR